jgi:homoprotocatechuate degradation regulator HpaR
MKRSMRSLAVTDGAPMREFDRSLPMSLLRAREAVMDRFRPVLREHGVTEQQWRVLRALAATGPIDAGGLAEICCLLRPSLTRILRDLLARGLIARHTNAEDQRVSEISITHLGEALIAEVGPHSERQYREIADLLGPADLERLYALLERLEARLKP